MNEPSDPALRTIFRLQAVVTRAPFGDGAQVELRKLGCYTSMDAARAWIRGSDFRKIFEPDAEVERLLFIQGVEEALDLGHREHVAQLTISPAGDLLESMSIHRAFLGREPSSCRWHRGDIAGCVHQRRYRIGIVLALPPSGAWLRAQCRPGITSLDDVYLLGFAGDDLEHHHPTEAVMFEPLAEVPAELVRRLEERLRGYPVVG
jgi:hypothetical protein